MAPKMKRISLYISLLLLSVCAAVVSISSAAEPASPSKAFIDGTAPGWRALGEADFVNVNCAPDTWSWKDGTIHCTGKPVGVMRSKKPTTNFELVAQWRHLKSRRQLGHLRLDDRGGAEGPEAGKLPPAASKCRCSTTATPSSTKSRPARRPIGSRPTATCFPSARRR